MELVTFVGVSVAVFTSVILVLVARLRQQKILAKIFPRRISLPSCLLNVRLWQGLEITDRQLGCRQTVFLAYSSQLFMLALQSTLQLKEHFFEGLGIASR